MPIFPEMPVPVPGPALAGSNGSDPALPPGDTSGVMPGLEASIANLLRNYRPGDIGICELADKIGLTLPVTEWDKWVHFGRTAPTPSMAGGAETGVVFYTVAADERGWLEYVFAERATGDNTLRYLRVVVPSAYSDGGQNYGISEIAAGAAPHFWPDPGGIQTVQMQAVPPVLLEPGTTLEVVGAGVGVSASTFNVEYALKLSKLTRAMAP